MNLKLVVFLIFCVILAAAARPGRGRGGKSRGGKGKKPGPERSLVKLCTGLDDGGIVNTDSAYDDVFTALDPVCDDLLAFVEAQDDSDAPGKRGKGVRKDGDTDDDAPAAADLLRKFCRDLDRAETRGFPDNLPTELSDIFETMGPICEDVETIFEASKTTTTTTTVATK